MVSTTRRDFPWSNTHHVDGDLSRAVKTLKKVTPRGLLVGGPKLSAALQRLDLVDEYRFVVHNVRKSSFILLTAGFVGWVLKTLFPIIRHSRLTGTVVSASDTLRQLFEAVVRPCMNAGLVKGEGFAVDASVMEADASRYHGKTPDEIDWSLPQRQTRAVAEFPALSRTTIHTRIASCRR